jgi:haloalkane dehalogenase
VAAETAGPVEALRTPDARFANLPGYPFEPHYVTVGGGLRMHYVDEGPTDAPVVLMLHGEPSWSYLYRHMVPVFVDAGLRAVAPDLVGFGRSDKPVRLDDYSYQAHMDWLHEWLQALDLRRITLVCQDWGSLLGLRLAAEDPDRFDRIVVANGFLPIADRSPGFGFKAWRAFARWTPVLPIGRIVDTGSLRSLSKAERAAYDAPFPSRRHKAGARAFPRLVPTDPDDPAVPANRAAWAKLGTWEKPFLTLFGKNDPILGRADRPLQEHVPGARDQPHDRLAGSHFVQEDAGEEIARRTLAWLDGH